MKGSDFDEATQSLKAPEGHEDHVYELPVWHLPGEPVFISKWQLSWKERFMCLLQGHVWLHVLSHSHPPITIETSYPFEEKGWSIPWISVISAIIIGSMIIGIEILVRI